MARSLLDSTFVRALALGLLSLVAVSSAARADTTPLPGAVAKPSDFCLRLPFADGETGNLGNAYGGGIHDGTNRTGFANDYYALDLTIAGRANFGAGQPIVAAAAGTVRLAGWATEGWASYGQRVLIEHDYSDGHRYLTNYAHLGSVAVSEGQHVDAGQVIGTLGSSSNNSATGTVTHLHFVLYQDCTVGGSGTGGCYGGHAVVPEPLEGETNLLTGTQFLAGSASCSVADEDDGDAADAGDDGDEPLDEGADSGPGGGYGSGADAGPGGAGSPGDLYATGLCSAASGGNSAPTTILLVLVAVLRARRRPR